MSTTSTLEDRLGIRFSDPALLETALTHRSSLNEESEQVREDNERLEFLGDSIVGFVVAEALYRAFPLSTEGSLTNMRAELVRASALAGWARGLGLGDHVVVGHGEEVRGGRNRDSLLCSAFEAVVGAIFLDQGLDSVRALIEPRVATALPGLTPGSARSRDAKSELQYRCQARWGLLPTYRIVEVTGPEHRPVFAVEVVAGEEIVSPGVGPSKQTAEQVAARAALLLWDQRYGTDGSDDVRSNPRQVVLDAEA